jgi:uncharacterized protein (DUF1697 family)
MPRYAAFIRAVNLGRNRRVSGAELRSLFEELGLEGVASFRTSGNVVFETGREARGKLNERIEERLEQALGHAAAVFLRMESEVRAIAEHQPFESKLVEGSKGKLQVVLLSGKPAVQARKKALALATDDDRLAFGERDLYWLPSAGTQQSGLEQKELGELLGSTTVRTKGTIEQLVAKYFS